MKNKEYTNLILSAGLILGVIYTAISYLPYLSGNNELVVTLSNIASIVAIAWALIFYGKKAAAIKDVDGMGFSYGQAFGFSLLVLILAGVIIGIGMSLLQNYIDPEYFDNLVRIETQKQLEKMNMSINDIPDEQLSLMNKMQSMMRQPILMVFLTTISTAFVGGIVALITSIFVRRQPQMFPSRDIDNSQEA